jgi:SAM-dependent methyltransferase
MDSEPESGLRDQSIRDFGDQWTRFTRNEGYYASRELLRDIVEPLLPVAAVEGARTADIGSGTGRIVRMLAAAGASSIVAVEPSAAFDVLQQNVADLGNRVTCVRGRGEELPGEAAYDLVLSIGVLHHIPDPRPVVRRAHQALHSGGRILIWLYGAEGNRLYLALVRPLRAVTKRMPHGLLTVTTRVLDLPLVAYIAACRRLSFLPLAAYMQGHLGRLDAYARRLTIYDQLNPAWAKYYRREEAEALLRSAGFVEVRSHHRHGYSWTVTGIKG